ncbi:D-2-hydroxyacid dehydrogenase family protein [Xanthomonas vasicola]|uniref:D-2-hydroxyacid dehydrogenase family protein n=1 Tax=Xanthomonas vasicola TaxID=56459 RepID=UPI0002F9E89D|nr:D-2-hydroxyacid dehydrogenase family protein [Xanthomonas vasicola]AZR25189.1 D-2-hydroxyacid dehydrogenase family protein [Xanthomonas vasicola pv. arecae]AZR29208.1 D-2-hydroxyacid dehydrogenase family protein [Xanthomonas vasicola pv. musacearum NCPPB 4379]KEZ98645.1 3-phosphoglycerate dehydrogenase [Xanthomonas vasicola pv. vasculorum NCPPB 895]KFA11007.1 3-phosphoglycerate dehydrogenase [Xanthomonas vasicola pv. musacearum NCPPB 2005]KFA15570.1 3-phosphoglycerate dehydrogenase [Xanthom
MRILVPDDYQGAVAQLPFVQRMQGHQVQVIGALDEHLDVRVACLADADALVLIRERTRVDAALLQRLPRLKLISQTGRVGAHVDVAACTALGVAVAEGVGSPVAPAELTWALILSVSRRLTEYQHALQQGRWQALGDPGLGRVLHGRTLGIWSYGRIGQCVAGFGRAFGMQVLVWGGEASCAQAARDGFAIAGSREELFERSDVVSLHRRLTAQTRHDITAQDLARMRGDALLVNTSRAELIAPGALLAALDAGRPGYAALDVFEHEPVLDPHDPLLLHPRVLATPHLGYVERDSYALYFDAAFDNVLAFAAGTPRNLVNPEVLATTKRV